MADYTEEQLQTIGGLLEQAVGAIGPGLNKVLPLQLYEFIRRYDDMFCTDVVIVPDEPTPSVILGKRHCRAVAPNQWWLFGGRVNKELRYEKVTSKRTKSEIGLDVSFGSEDIIGLGRTYFAPDSQEEKLRDHDVSTINICFAKKVDLRAINQSIQPADGNVAWQKFTRLDENWHPYVISSIAHAWERTHPENNAWKEQIRTNPKLEAAVKDRFAFTSLRYSPVEF